MKNLSDEIFKESLNKGPNKYGPEFTKLIQEKDPETISLEEAFKMMAWANIEGWRLSTVFATEDNPCWINKDLDEVMDNKSLLEIFRSGKERKD